MEIRKTFTFDAAHHLPKVPEGHKCGRVHGHTYQVVLVIEGPIDEEMGWVVDFADVTEVWKVKAHSILDHHDLNELLYNPTAENLAIELGKLLAPDIPGLYRVEVWETPTSMAAWEAS